MTIHESLANAYWQGTPDGRASSIIYSAASAGVVVSLPDGATAIPWPNDEVTGVPTIAALDAVLAYHGMPVTGLATPTKADLITYANRHQWALATGGYTISIAGTPRAFKTDETSFGLITGKALRMQQTGAPTSVRWQFGPTTFVEIGLTDFIAFATEIADFMQASFDAVEPIISAIEAGTITTKAEIDAASWPSNVA